MTKCESYAFLKRRSFLVLLLLSFWTAPLQGFLAVPVSERRSSGRTTRLLYRAKDDDEESSKLKAIQQSPWTRPNSYKPTQSKIRRITRHRRHRRPSQFYKDKSYQPRSSWLTQVTLNLLESEPGSLQHGKWHELISIFNAWSKRVKQDADAPTVLEALLKRWLDESTATPPTIEHYNQILDAWACAALFQTTPNPKRASQRAREILVCLQESYESNPTTTAVQPNAKSFDLVLHVVCRLEGATVARRLLAWMEFLVKRGRNPYAQPLFSQYQLVLKTYFQNSKNNREAVGPLVEAFLRHMTVMGVEPDTYCYNLAIKAYTQCARGHERKAAEHADRILQSMTAPKDLITYSSVIAAWANSGMKRHAVARAEELLQELEQDLPLNTIIINTVMSAWVRSKIPAAVQRTRELLQFLEDSPDLQPDLISYNNYLHALALHSGTHPECAQQAKELLERMQELARNGTVAASPNLFSYNLVIEAWAKCSHPWAASQAGGILRNLLQQDHLEPDNFSFNQVLSACAKRGAARQAEDLMNYMLDAQESGLHSKAKPNVLSYTHVIVANTNSGATGAALRAEEWLNRLKRDPHLRPSRIVYNAAISAWAKSGEGTMGARKAESLLQEMQQLSETGDDSMTPNIVTYNAVLHAWARSGTRCCGLKAEYYLNKMWELYQAGEKQVKPNDLSYNTVINAISKSQNEYKAQKALRILRRMDLLYRAGNKEARPNEVTYTSVLNSCAFPAVHDPRTRRKALDTAIFTLKELRASRYGQPNQLTYGTFIKACANLLPKDDEMRRTVIEKAFRQCCKDGQVGEIVLSGLREAAPSDLYEKLLSKATRSSSVVTVSDLPREWRCNVREIPSSRRIRSPRSRKRSTTKRPAQSHRPRP